MYAGGVIVRCVRGYGFGVGVGVVVVGVGVVVVVVVVTFVRSKATGHTVVVLCLVCWRRGDRKSGQPLELFS